MHNGQFRLGASEILEESHGGARHKSPNYRQGWVISESRKSSNPIPEPSAALIFGVGMLVASGLVSRTGTIE